MTIAGKMRAIDLKLFRRIHPLLEFGLLFVVALATYCAVLKFVFPKYLSPLWPHHSDFYIPVAVAGGFRDTLAYLTWPRPVGMIFFVLIGNLGTRGSIAVIVAMTIFNAAISVYLLRRIIETPLSAAFLFFSVAYFFILFSSPFFYVFYSQDAFGQLSFFLLAIGAAIFVGAFQRYLVVATVSLFFFALAAFLAKETYILSAACLACTFFWFAQDDSKLARLLPLLAILAALSLSLASGIENKSTFLGFSNGPYETNFSPFSIARELWRYATGGLNPLSIAAIGLSVLACWRFGNMKGKENATKAAICILVACAAWLPNATLPQHFFPGYSWNGAYLLFLPIVLVASTINRSMASAGLAAVISATVFASPLLNHRKYESNKWTLMQEATQRNLLSVLHNESASLPLDRQTHILITGMTFPFNPFGQPRAIEEITGHQQIHFDILSYSDALNSNSSTVSFVRPATVDLSQYDAVWELRSDGTLREAINPALGYAAATGDERCPSRWCFVLYPSMADVTKPADGTFNANQYNEIGLAWLTYPNYSAAEQAFRKSAKIDPLNPYTYFFLGNTLKSHGDLVAAAAAYKHAIEIENPANKNPFFDSALNDIQREMNKKAP